MNRITSRDNQQLKFARKVCSGKVADKIFVEGLRLAKETLKSSIRIIQAYVSDAFLEKDDNLSLIKKLDSDTQVYVLSERLLKTISDTKSPQGIIFVCDKPNFAKNDFPEFNALGGKLPIIILLHQINNPNNLGAIFRSAEAVDVKGVMLTKNSASVFSPKSLRASMGAVLRVHVWENIDFEKALEWAKKENLITTCADINATNSYTEINWKAPRLLIFGSEAHGLSSSERNKISDSILIPLENKVESLNLSVSFGVMLFEAKRQFNLK